MIVELASGECLSLNVEVDLDYLLSWSLVNTVWVCCGAGEFSRIVFLFGRILLLLEVIDKVCHCLVRLRKERDDIFRWLVVTLICLTIGSLEF